MHEKSEVKKTEKFKSLTFTLAVAFLALSAVVLFISGALNIYFSMQTQQRVIDSQQRMIAHDAADSVNSFILGKFNELKNGARLSNIAVANQEEQKILLERLIGFDPAFRQVALLNTQGEELIKVSRLSSFATGKVTDLIEDPLFAESIKQNDYISSIYIDEITSEPLVVISIPLNDIFGDLKGILMAEVNLKFMWDLVGSIKVGDKGVAYVVDNTGKLIAFEDVSRVLKRENQVHLEEIRKFVESSSHIQMANAEITKGIYGNYVVTTHEHLGSPDWVVVVEMPVMEAYENVITQIKLSLLFMILSFIFAIIVGIFLSRRITKPIIKLRDTAVEIGKGKLDTQIDIKTRNEIEDLASSFNQMTKNLKNSRKKIEDYSRNLEQKVKERTKKLAEANAKLKELDKEKDEFISVAAHELKTPLTSIKGFAQLMDTDTVMKNRKKLKHYLELVNQNTIRLYNLILDIVDSSRMSLGKLKLECKEVDVNEIFKEVRETLTIVIKEKGITPVFFIDKNMPKIKADPQRLLQVIRNLIVNATHFTHEKGIITFKVYRKGKFVQFEVKDTGEGIPKDKQKNIFSRFYQADASLTRKVKGSGLGLSICKGFVELMKGRIWFESEEKKGTTFYFTVPLAKNKKI
ncbi:sensor histidine kinase [Candidatus Woesearchaeota archaeon]|nr:sensor histidine kinase [Candidatus Woesearchaeota archaeon]